MVVFYHFMGARWAWTREFNYASMIFNGSDAVSFFFVLSGFVLSFKYLQADVKLNIRAYTYKRFLRLYPAYLITVLANYLYMHWNADMNLLLDMVWHNSKGLWEELFMVRGRHDHYLAGWTLEVEMVLSLLMPIFIVAAKKDIRLIYWLIPFTFFIGKGHLSIYTVHFALGIILAYFFKEIQAFDFKSSRWYKWRWLIGVVVFLLFSMRHIERLSPFGPSYWDFAAFFSLDMFHYTGLASFIMLAGVINSPAAQRFFTHRILVWLGEISYSVYLSHWLIVSVVMSYYDKTLELVGGSGVLAGAISLSLILAATLLISTLMYRGIERPFIAYAKRKVKTFRWLRDNRE